MMTRELVWDGCLNVRDLGGLPTEDGGMTRFGSVVRADNVRKLSDDGWQALTDYGVTTIVDLRLSDELAEDPPRELDLDVVHIPVFEGDAAFWAALDARLSGLDAVAHKREAYLAALEQWHRRFGEAFAAVANARDGIVVVHCAGGKDRTGLVSALLLRRELRSRLAAAPAEAMRGVLEETERRRGSVAGYLREAGVDDETLARGRARIRNGA
jgi:protein-tyrosine phosphatase